MKKILAIAITILVVSLTLGINPFYQKKKATENTFQTNKKIAVQQKINAENFKRYEVEEGRTALDLLKQTAKVSTKGEKENAFVTEINEKKADETKKEYWSFSINGTIAPVGAGSYALKNKDKIEWKIEHY